MGLFDKIKRGLTKTRNAFSGRMDELVENYQEERGLSQTLAGSTDSEVPEAGSVEKWPRDKIWKTSMTQNPGVQEYGDRRAEILDYGLMNERGEITSMITKGETFTVLYRFRLNERIENPIFAFTFRDMKGAELCGTNTMYEDQTIEKVQVGLTGVVRFTQRMTLQGGHYMLALGLTGFIDGELHAYHRLYDVCDVEVMSDRNTVGVFDMESKVEYDDVMVIREEK